MMAELELDLEGLAEKVREAIAHEDATELTMWVEERTHDLLALVERVRVAEEALDVATSEFATMECAFTEGNWDEYKAHLTAKAIHKARRKLGLPEG